MSRPAGGASLDAHYVAAQRQGFRAAPKPPPLPPEAIDAWNAFTRLHAARGIGPMGAAPISWGEIEAFMRLTRTDLQPWEVAAIRALDESYLALGSAPAGAGRSRG